MTAKIVNLRRARKGRARAAARAAAGANAVRHGEGRLTLELREARAALARRRLDGHRRDDGDER